MDLRSTRVSMRPWQHHDEAQADAWPPYHDPFEPLWNLSRQSSSWPGGFEFGSRRTWAVETQDGKLAGRISLREVDERRGSARLGITFGAPYVGKGLGSEALELFIDYFFEDLGFAVMVLDVAGPNRRAIRSYERLGFVYVGNDWRCVGNSFDRRLLDQPQYSHVQRFFRQGPRCFEVQFFEMELQQQGWLRRSR
ncbi:MAG: GNAT family N-acetyltransferase [Roseiflexaceae bacterium]|nr:GNAT family N-acetyltransferase [Roseiflexaceae bacterium]